MLIKKSSHCSFLHEYKYYFFSVWAVFSFHPKKESQMSAIDHPDVKYVHTYIGTMSINFSDNTRYVFT
jgi:hypothetical protein